MRFRWPGRHHSSYWISQTTRAKDKYRVFATSSRGYAPNTEAEAKAASWRTRNIGIIAHIDAGKTTTTERMLYYSGFTRRIGDVDEGSTVTDFLPAERARGITIQSAAITFTWPPIPDSTPNPATTSPTSPPLPSSLLPRSSTPHNINLIDTPGHADFTFEVLRSLRVLDGAVCILDGVAGVEAQTEKVWAQADAYAIPRIVYVNKLDREGAAFARTVREVGGRLGVWPAVCGVPWWDAEGRLVGVGDVVGLRGLRYVEGGDGKEIRFFGLGELEAEDAKLAAELRKARIALVELLSENDEEIVESYLEADEDHLAISPLAITESLRRCVLHSPQALVPVFAGASFRNIGVQPLLDAVVDLLPSPSERPDPEISFGGETRGGLSNFLSGNLALAAEQQQQPNPHKPSPNKNLTKDKPNLALQNLEACALAFKVVSDPRRGVLVYIRVYAGAITRNALLWNCNLQLPERAQRLLRMYANEAVEIDAIAAGQIGVIPGLKAARTGDTLIAYVGANPKSGPPAPASELQLRPIDVPPPVFFVSVEPNSLAEEKHLRESLEILLREDPSLQVVVDEESGQTQLSGMGELHLEIARDRLVQDLKAKARIGRIEIGYREAVTGGSGVVTEVLEREVAGKSSKARCSVSVSPLLGEERDADVGAGEHTHVFTLHDNNILTITTPAPSDDSSPPNPEDPPPSPPLPPHLPLPTVLTALRTGVSAALARGPTHAFPLHSTQIHITFSPAQDIFPNTTAASLASAARVAVQKALRLSARQSETVLMEPVMRVTIVADEGSVGDVVHDISSSRGGSVISFSSTASSSSGDATPTDGEDEAPSRASIAVEKIYAPPDPFAGSTNISSTAAGTSANAHGSEMRQIIARVPLKEMLGYLTRLRSLTGGRGTFTMVVDRFERMGPQRQRAVVGEMMGGEVL